MSKEKVINLDSNQEEPVNTELANDYQPTEREILDDKLQQVADIKNRIESYKGELKDLNDLKRYSLLIANIGNKTEYRMRAEFNTDEILEKYKQFLQEKIDGFYAELKDLLK